MKKSILWWLMIALVAAIGIAGIINCPSDWSEAGNWRMKLLPAFVTSYGITGIAAAIGLIFHKRWAIWPMIVWAFSGVAAAGFSNVIFAPKGSTWWIMIVAFLLGWALSAMVKYSWKELTKVSREGIS